MSGCITDNSTNVPCSLGTKGCSLSHGITRHTLTAADTSSLGHMPGARWAFDESVTECFDDMLARSIPEHEEMRRVVAQLSRLFVRPGAAVVDLGCSRGETIARVRDACKVDGDPNRWIEWHGLEVSPPMLAAARERFRDDSSVTIVEHDLRRGIPSPSLPTSLVLSVLTLQFTPIEYRQQIVASVYDLLSRGSHRHDRPGAFILVEKVLGASARIDASLVDAYYDRKRASGYSDAEIERKRHALEGVLVPVTARWNEDLLRGAGFVEVDCVWRCLNFAAWLAVTGR